VRRLAGWSLVLVGTVLASLGVVLFPAAVARLIDGRSSWRAGQIVVTLVVGLGVSALGFALAAPNGRRPLGTLALRAIGMALIVGGPLFGMVWTGLANFDADTGVSYRPQGWAITACGLALLVVAVRLERSLRRRADASAT
jgi:hypothetical protein